MHNDEGLNTKLWLEQWDVQTAHQDDPIQPQTAKITLDAPQYSRIDHFIKSNKLQWGELILATWALLIEKLSTTDISIIGYSNVTLKDNKKPIIDTIHPVKSIINEKISVKKHLNEIKKQFAIKTPHKELEADEIRYLLLFQNSSKKTANTIQLDINKHPLCLVSDKKHTGKLHLTYNPLLYKKNTIKKIIKYLTHILAGILSDTNQAVTSIDILNQAEKSKILNNWCQPKYGFSIPDCRECPHVLSDNIARKKPKSLAIQHGKIKVNFSELKEYSDRIANLLLTAGVTHQDKIAVIMDRSPILVLSMLGIFKSNCIFVPINNKYPDDRIEFVLEDCNAQYVLATNKQRVPSKYHDRIILLPNDWKNLPNINNNAKLPEPKIGRAHV